MTTQNDYLHAIVDMYKLASIPDTNTFWSVELPLKEVITKWANSNGLTLCQIKRSGSRAKGTAILLSSDLDLFISISSSTNTTLHNVYYSLYEYLKNLGYNVRKQNVSIGVYINGTKVDLVPGIRQHQFGNDHSLYRSKRDTWTQTNIDTHISQIKNSNRLYEIMALKIWRERNGLDFPSIYLELLTIKALRGKAIDDWANNFYYVLKYIANNITEISIMDPANTNNCISDDLSLTEKKRIALQAQTDSVKPLVNIIW